MRVSIVIRTFNEARYLPALLAAVAEQATAEGESVAAETIVVDSGSTDQTIEIARRHGATVLHIPTERFSFGRSLNIGCEAASGEILAFISGHCVPCSRQWLSSLTTPIASGTVELAYGRQLGGPETKHSEHQLFAKLYPAASAIPQQGFFCNNANAALRRSTWERYRFDEELLGLEDMDLGKRLLAHGHALGYVAEAPIYHYHHETWSQVRRRYEREAIALQRIRPEWQISFLDFVGYLCSSVLHDSTAAIRQRRLPPPMAEIVLFRFMQYWGTYRGNHAHRKLVAREKHKYFYPK